MTSVISNNELNTKAVKGRSTQRVSAYSFFQKDATERGKVKDALGENPNFGQISKGMSEAWKALTEPDRAKYQALSDKAKADAPQSTLPTQSTQSKAPKEPKEPKATKPTTSTKKRKRARSAYTLFTMDETVKSHVKAENPDADFGALSKLLGAKWKALPESEKVPYQEVNAIEKAELASQQPSPSDKTPVVKKRKRARSAYTLYSSDTQVRETVKAANPAADFGSLSKIIATQWKNLPESEKEVYQTSSDKEKAEMVAAKLASGEPVSGKVRKRARSAYTRYTMDSDVKAQVKVSHPEAGFTDFSKILASQWKELTEEQRKPYHEANLKEKAEMAANPPTLAQVGGDKKKPKQKRAKSAYTLYSSDTSVRDTVKAANPEADFGTLSKIISAQWKALGVIERKPYDEKSQVEKTAMAEIKAANKPKKTRAKSAYLHYSMNPTVRGAAKKANPEMSVTDLAKVLGAQWKQLPDVDRKPYQEAYETEKAELVAQKETSESNSN